MIRGPAGLFILAHNSPRARIGGEAEGVKSVWAVVIRDAMVVPWWHSVVLVPDP